MYGTCRISIPLHMFSVYKNQIILEMLNIPAMFKVLRSVTELDRIGDSQRSRIVINLNGSFERRPLSM